jgi:hypothetical protein
MEFDTSILDPGYYTVVAKAVDESDYMGMSEGILFSINNWNLTSLLPPNEPYKAGRTIPVKFRLTLVEEVDPGESFVYSEDLVIKIYNGDHALVQRSVFGTGSTNYRITQRDKLYITNFKTSKTPDTYYVKVMMKNDGFVVGEMTFITE